MLQFLGVLQFRAVCVYISTSVQRSENTCECVCECVNKRERESGCEMYEC